MQPEKMGMYSRLISIVGPEGVSDHPADITPYMSDSYSLVMQKDAKLADFIVLSENAHQVQELVRLANEFRIPVYPRRLVDPNGIFMGGPYSFT